MNISRAAVLRVYSPQLMLQRLGGLSILERQLFTCAKAGIKHLWVAGFKPEAQTLAMMRLPQGLEVFWSGPEKNPSAEAVPAVIISGDYLIRPQSLANVIKSGASAADILGNSVVEVQGRPASEPRRTLGPESCFHLTSPLLRKAALSWLLTLARKSQDGLMARYFDRHISLAVSGFLLETPVTPNMVTVASSLIGLAGAAFFLKSDYIFKIWGSLFILLHSVIDGCDGELARLRFQESALGAELDFWSDNVVHLALFSCLAVGFWRQQQNAAPLLLGLAACLGTLGAAALFFKQRVLKKLAGRGHPDELGLASGLDRLEDALAARDFIYLLVVLSFLRLDYWFLWAGAVGAPLFFLLTFYLGRVNHEHESNAHQDALGQAGSSLAGDGGGRQHIYRGR